MLVELLRQMLERWIDCILQNVWQKYHAFLKHHTPHSCSHISLLNPITYHWRTITAGHTGGIGLSLLWTVMWSGSILPCVPSEYQFAQQISGENIYSWRHTPGTHETLFWTPRWLRSVLRNACDSKWNTKNSIGILQQGDQCFGVCWYCIVRRCMRLLCECLLPMKICRWSLMNLEMGFINNVVLDCAYSVCWLRCTVFQFIAHLL